MNSIDEIDLNIENYDYENLISFFNLNDTVLHENILEEKKNSIYTVLLNDSNLAPKKKLCLFNFINKAYDKLLINIGIDKHKKTNKKLINNHTITNDIDLSNLYTEKTNLLNDYTISDDADKSNGLTNSHPIVNKPYTKFIYTNNSCAFDGIINPLEKKVMTKVLCLDTRFRENFCNTNSNNFCVQLSAPLENVISMNLISFEIPRLWYSVSSILKNNTFKISLYNMVGYSDNVQTIVIPDGNYSNTVLVDVINNYFTNVGNGLNYLRFVVDTTTSKASFFVKSNPEVDTILPYDPSNASYSPNFYYELDFLTCEGFGLHLGYLNSNYTSNINTYYIDNFNVTPAVTYFGIITSESCCGSNIDNYIFVDVNDFNKNFNTNTVMSQKENSFIGNNILGKVVIGFPDHLILNDSSDCIFKRREYYGPVRIKKLQITLLNKYGYPLDLLNNNYSISLEFNILYS